MHSRESSIRTLILWNEVSNQRHDLRKRFARCVYVHVRSRHTSLIVLYFGDADLSFGFFSFARMKPEPLNCLIEPMTGRLPHFNLLSLFGRIVLLSYRFHQYLQWFHLSFRQETKLCAKEQKVFEARVEMRSHIESLKRSEETRVNDAIDSKDATKNLTAESRKLWRLKNTQGDFIVLIVGKLIWIIHLVSYGIPWKGRLA
jgi:hypothetical protein